MRRVLFCIVIGFLLISPPIILAATLLFDDFSGNIVSSLKWHIPTWVSPTDGTFIGQTQFRCTQNSSLPAAKDSNAIITVESYNPTGFSFYGTDLISNQSFSLGEGIHITVRAKMNASTPGIVGGIFLYALKPGSTTLHDEINFELLTNLPSGVQTNIYSNEPLGRGHPQFVAYTSGSITDYHIYEIKWEPNQVSWFIDGILVRKETGHVPTGSMKFHLNIWVPDSEWTQAYSSDLKPTPSESSNQIFRMSIDSVNINSIASAPETSCLIPMLHPLLLDKTP
jgi:beta-glucanase (GH16 family)